MASSTATAYRETGVQQSAKNAPTSPFTLIARVRASSLVERHKRLIAAMLSKNRFGDELWLSTESLQIIVGRVCYRRKKEPRDSRGRNLGNCDFAARRSVQRWIDEAVTDEVLKPVYPANVWVGHGSARKFRRSATYELNHDKLAPALTYDEWSVRKRAAKPETQPLSNHRSSHRSSPTHVQEPSSATSPAAPVPVREAPAQFPLRKLTRDERAALVRIYVSLRHAREGAPLAASPPQPEAEQAWRRILAFVKAKINPHVFDTWLRATSGLEIRDGVLCVSIPSDDFLHLGQKFRDLFSSALAGLQLPYESIQFLSPPRSESRPALSSADALAEACRQLRISVDDGTVALKISGYDVDRGAQ